MCRGIKYQCNKILIGLCLLLAGCANKPPAPIIDGWHQPAARQSAYTVQPGDTLYSIAWAFDMDFRDLAQLNHLSAPYHLQAGQKLRMGISTKSETPRIHKARLTSTVTTKGLKATKGIAQNATKLSSAAVQSSSATTAPSNLAKITGKWLWPTQGKVVKTFSLNSGGTKGIEIAGRLGQPVVASSFGKVVYSGSGLRGYGNLIIIKHNDTFLSAYAYNQKLLVKENANVKAGQVIALMGRNNAGQVMLHFEIRRNGKPVNPLLLLRSSNNVLKE